MLGRLARYLRMVGLDTAYVTGLGDDEVAVRARGEGRLLVTRDRLLAQRVPGAILLVAASIEGQWRELRRRYPALPNVPRFERCTLCNGVLSATLPSTVDPISSPVPSRILESGTALFRCAQCGHIYWEGSHVESMRHRLARWDSEGSP
jgi:uncharacterized protein with PIN domain